MANAAVAAAATSTTRTYIDPLNGGGYEITQRTHPETTYGPEPALLGFFTIYAGKTGTFHDTSFTIKRVPPLLIRSDCLAARPVHYKELAQKHMDSAHATISHT